MSKSNSGSFTAITSVRVLAVGKVILVVSRKLTKSQRSVRDAIWAAVDTSTASDPIPRTLVPAGFVK